MMTKAPIHGYSGKPLFQKMGLKPGVSCLVIAAPKHYEQLMAGAEGVLFRKRSKQADVVHAFFKDRAALDRQASKCLSKVAPGGMLWVSWPKKSSPLFKDLTEGQLRDVFLPKNWVDIKVCAVDADWSGLKFVRRKTPSR